MRASSLVPALNQPAAQMLQASPMPVSAFGASDRRAAQPAIRRGST
jgi:hypothetical protein